MAANLLLPAIKALGSSSMKKAVTGVAKDKAKNFVTGKKRSSRRGALVKSEGGSKKQTRVGSVSSTTPMVGRYKVETVTDKPDNVGKPSKVSYDTINNQLDSIIGLTNVLKKTSAAKIKNAENRRKAERKASEKSKKRQRESLLEKGAGKALGVAGNLLGRSTGGFDPLRFLAMIFLGNLVKWFNEEGSKISAFLRTGLALMNNAGKLIKAGLKTLGRAFRGSLKLIGKVPRIIGKLGRGIGKTILGVGRRLGRALSSIGRGLKNYIGRVLGRLRIPGFRPRPSSSKPPKPDGQRLTLTGSGAGLGTAAQQRGRSATAGFRSPGRYRAPGEALAGGTFRSQQTRAQLTGPQSTAVPGSLRSRFRQFSASAETGTLFGGKGARFQRGANRFLKMLFGITKPQDVKKLKDASPVLKKGSNFMKGARIPVVGPMIVFALTALDPNPETGGIGRAAFKAIGTGLGEFLGFGIPIPILGPIIGGLVGEVMGDAAYELIVKKSPAKAGQKIMDAVTATANFFGPIMEWGKGVVTRFFDSLPKVNVFGQEFLNPFGFTEVPKALMNAFFGKDQKKGEVKQLTGQSKQISEGSYYHQPGVGYFRVGGAGEYLGATEEEARAKLGLSPTTNINPNVSASSPEGYVSSLMPQSKASAFYKAMGINEQMWKTYKDTIASIETSGYSLADSYKAIGGSGDAYDGRYQMGRLARMDAAQALGIPTPSREELRNNAQLQEDMFLAYTYKNYTYMSGASSQFDSASNVQKLQYLGYAHNQGHAFATDWLKTGVISSVDGFGTKGTKFTDKLAKTLKPYLSGSTPKVVTDGGARPVTPQNQDQSESVAPSSSTPAQIKPSTQSQKQMSSGISGISRQLPYEETGGTTVVMAPGSNRGGGVMGGGRRAGTPVIMGSGDVVNSYYKSQLLGFLYKQG